MSIKLVRSTRMSEKFLSFIIDDDPIADDGSQSLLYQVLSNTGVNTLGVIAIEVWTLTYDRTKLVLSKGGFWVDPVYISTSSSKPLLRLIDDARSDHLPPVPLSPGVGLAGTLWSDFNGMQLGHGSNITWRDIHQISSDPDQPLNYRLKALSEAGFGIAAGLPFHKHSVSGIVVYMARKSSFKFDENYLHSATDLFGTLLSHERETRRVAHNRDKFLTALIRRVKIKLMSVSGVRGMSTNVNTTPQDNSYKHQLVDSVRSQTHKVLTRTQMWFKKLRGAQMHAPPPLPISNALFVVTAAFIQMGILAWVSQAIGIRTQGKFNFRMGTVAALTCMQYTLTSAPAGQPLTGLLATFVSCLIALATKQIPFVTAVWIRPAVASSLAIVAMALTGVPHPPAAGTAIAFSTDDVHMRDVGMLLLSYVIAIALATIINNVSETRQYPIFWTNYWVERIITAIGLKIKSKVETGTDTNMDITK